MRLWKRFDELAPCGSFEVSTRAFAGGIALDTAVPMRPGEWSVRYLGEEEAEDLEPDGDDWPNAQAVLVHEQATDVGATDWSSLEQVAEVPIEGACFTIGDEKLKSRLDQPDAFYDVLDGMFDETISVGGTSVGFHASLFGDGRAMIYANSSRTVFVVDLT